MKVYIDHQEEIMLGHFHHGGIHLYLMCFLCGPTPVCYTLRDPGVFGVLCHVCRWTGTDKCLTRQTEVFVDQCTQRTSQTKPETKSKQTES